MTVIVCRARRSKSCYDGRDAEAVYGEGGMENDGLFDGTSVVCDACYVGGGQPALYVGGSPTSDDLEDARMSGHDPVVHVDRKMGLMGLGDLP